MHRLAQTLATLFYPLVEVSLLRQSGEEIAVFNRLDKTTDRKKGNKGLYYETLSDGRKVKVGELIVEGVVFRIRYDTSLFFNLHAQLAHLVGSQETEEEARWETQIDLMIQNFLKERHLTLEGAGKKEKRELIYALHARGAFNYKEAAHYISKILHLSRATLYNYLKLATTMATVNIHQVDTFTRKRFGGNPAGVVLDAALLDEEIMRKIAREMNLSETAFVLPSKKGNFNLRYFTPTGDEVAFCGHSTVGALYMLAHEKREGMRGAGHYHFTVETLAGLLDMQIKIGKDESITILYEAPKIDWVIAPWSHEELCEALGIDPILIDASLPIFLERTNRTLMMGVRSLKELGTIHIDLKRAEGFARRENIVVFALVSQETFDPANDAHIRCFAPAVGIPEDPFTGSILGGIAAYLLENGLIDKKKRVLGVEQGHFMKRPGHVKIYVKKGKEGYQATIVAHAVHLFSTQMQLR